MKKHLAPLLALMLYSSVSQAQWTFEGDKEKGTGPVTMGVGINFLPLLGNNPTILLSTDLTFLDVVGLEVGAGPLFGAEVWTTNFEDAIETPGPQFYMLGAMFDNEKIDLEYGYRTYGELKVYLLQGSHKPYFSTGYSLTQSWFSADYVLRVDNGFDRYYQNVSEDYQVNTHIYYAKVGYRFVFGDSRAFFEPSISYRFVDKEVSPTLYRPEGDIVSNEDFVDNFDDFPLPICFDFKFGIVLF